MVAQEVGKLAGSTQDSLVEVQKVISKVQDNVSSMAVYMEDNTKKLARQNEVFAKTFDSLQEMITLLKHSMKAISSMNQVHRKQEEVIHQTVSINETIAQSIRVENQEFGSISHMVDSNTAGILQMTEQVDAINKMVEEMEKLLQA